MNKYGIFTRPDVPEQKILATYDCPHQTLAYSLRVRPHSAAMFVNASFSICVRNLQCINLKTLAWCFSVYKGN